jgi:predicted amidohydrolase YtcJ
MAPGLFVSAGVWTSLSTDAPIVPPDWKQNIEFAVLRQNETSPPGMARPEYRVSVKEAIIAYTRTPAYQEFQEDIKGTIEVGKLADLAVIDKNPLAIDPRDISEIKTLMTVLGGSIVYENLTGVQ